MKNARMIMLMLAVAVLVVIAGCQKVSVVDEKGSPIAFAKVQVTSHGGEGSSMPIMTDVFGNVLLPLNLAEPDAKEFLIVSKEGYISRNIQRIKDSDMTITLPVSQRSIRTPEKSKPVAEEKKAEPKPE